jgi:hypothetical protein
MSLADLDDRGAVLRAVEEFDRLGRDAFLDRYGFDEARDYFLILDGRRYDSKAIAGVAHGYLPGRGPLRPSDFTGGKATVKRRLEGLRFTVQGPEEVRNPPWSRDELILALDLYLRNRGALPRPSVGGPSLPVLASRRRSGEKGCSHGMRQAQNSRNRTPGLLSMVANGLGEFALSFS